LKGNPFKKHQILPDSLFFSSLFRSFILNRFPSLKSYASHQRIKHNGLLNVGKIENKIGERDESRDILMEN